MVIAWRGIKDTRSFNKTLLLGAEGIFSRTLYCFKWLRNNVERKWNRYQFLYGNIYFLENNLNFDFQILLIIHQDLTFSLDNHMLLII